MRLNHGLEHEVFVEMIRPSKIEDGYTVVPSLNEVLAFDAESMLTFAYERGLLNGIVIGILKEGEAYVRTAGADVNDDSYLEIGSVTKTFTAELVDRMVKRGLLSWQDSFGLHLPGTLRRLDEIRRASSQITLLDLATHRAGLPLLPRNLKITDGTNPYGDYDQADVAQYLEEEFLLRPVRKRYNYSNLGFAILGYVLGNVAKTTYPELLKRELLDPLGLTHTGFSLTGDKLAPITQGYSETGKLARQWTQLAFAPTGGLYSTVGDQLQWIRYLLGNPDRSVFQRHAVRKNEDVGLGWKYDATHHAHERDGMTSGFFSYISVSPAKRWGLVVLSNRKTPDIVKALAKNFERSLEGLPARAMRGSYGSVKAHFIEKVRSNKMTYYLGRRARAYLK